MPKEVKIYDTDEIIEKIILVGVDSSINLMSAELCLDELEELVKTASGEVVGRVLQKREKPHPSYYLGKGKIEEIKIMINALDATGIVCDDELSPSQIKNLGQMLEVKIMDRTMVILDIFASRAQTKEGKIQVELAQLKYRLSRLVGIGASMSRLGGGIGTRGPGEKKLETDRRHIKNNIAELKLELKEISTHRDLLRNQRDKKGSVIVSLIGYTNSGKSTILNNLTEARVLAEDKLFATLDITTRKIKLPGGTDILLTDTVGFIQKLSHHLIEAFKSTLEELKYAHILLHVVDASNPTREEQMKVVYKTIKDLGCENIPVITVFNKMDKEIVQPLPNGENEKYKVCISAKNDTEVKKMLFAIEKVINSFRTVDKFLIPYTEGKMLNIIYGKCEVISEEHTPYGVSVKAYIDNEMSKRLEKYKV